MYKRLFPVGVAALLTACQRRPGAIVEPPVTLRRFSPATEWEARRLVGGNFHVVEHMRDIDPQILRRFNAASYQKGMADRGGKWNATDTVADTSLPFRRLLFAGHAPRCWFILYEQGGIDFSHQLVVLDQQPDGGWKIEAESFSLGTEDADLEQLKTSLRQGKYMYQYSGYNR